MDRWAALQSLGIEDLSDKVATYEVRWGALTGRRMGRPGLRRDLRPSIRYILERFIIPKWSHRESPLQSLAVTLPIPVAESSGGPIDGFTGETSDGERPGATVVIEIDQRLAK